MMMIDKGTLLLVQLATLLSSIRQEMDKNKAEVTVLRQVPAQQSAKKSSGGPAPLAPLLGTSSAMLCSDELCDLPPAPVIASGTEGLPSQCGDLCRWCNGRHPGEEAEL